MIASLHNNFHGHFPLPSTNTQFPEVSAELVATPMVGTSKITRLVVNTLMI